MQAVQDREDFTRDQWTVQWVLQRYKDMVHGSLDCINFQKVDMKLYELLKRKLEEIGKLSSAIFAMEMLVIE